MKRIFSVCLLVGLLLSLAACSGSKPAVETAAVSPELNLEEIYTAMLGADDMPQMLLLDADMQLNFCGIAAEDCLQAKVAICADSLRADEIWLLEAANPDALSRLQELAQARLTAKSEESVTYSPEQYAIVQKAEVITAGNYFVLLVSPRVDALAELFRAAAGI